MIQFIRDCQEAAGVETPSALALKADLSPSTINRFLSDPDHGPLSTTTLKKIADAAGVELPPLSKSTAAVELTPESVWRQRFAERLRIERETQIDHGLDDFQEVTGIERGRYDQIESGLAEPTIEELALIAEAAGVSADYLIFGASHRGLRNPADRRERQTS